MVGSALPAYALLILPAKINWNEVSRIIQGKSLFHEKPHQAGSTVSGFIKGRVHSLGLGYIHGRLDSECTYNVLQGQEEHSAPAMYQCSSAAPAISRKD